MDTLTLFIILTSVISAVVFKVVVLRNVNAWIDKDLIKSLSAGNIQDFETLDALNYHLKSQKIARSSRHALLEAEAKRLLADKIS